MKNAKIAYVVETQRLDLNRKPKKCYTVQYQTGATRIYKGEPPETVCEYLRRAECTPLSFCFPHMTFFYKMQVWEGVKMND